MTPDFEKTAKRHRGEAIMAIFWNLILMYIFYKVPDWDLPFINEKYNTVVWILYINVLSTIIGYILVFFFDFRWVWYLVRAILDGIGFVTMIVLYFVYPFDFSTIGGWSWLDIFIPIALIIGMIATVIGVIVNLWKLFFRPEK